MLIASLPMYDLPALIQDHDELWHRIHVNLASRGLSSPEKLDRGCPPINLSNRSKYYFTQTCRTPYRKYLHDHVNLVGTPDYRHENCQPGYYRSAIVVRDNSKINNISDMDGCTVSINEKDSWSGYESLIRFANKHEFKLGELIVSNSHLYSAQCVANGLADIAAIDQLTVKQSLQYDASSPFVSLRILCWTDESPTLPFVAHKDVNSTLIFDAVRQAINELSTSCRRRLNLFGITSIPKEKYLVT